MERYGFAAEVQDKTLRYGRCLVRPATMSSVFGYVPAEADKPITVALTDGKDCSSWPVTLACS